MRILIVSQHIYPMNTPRAHRTTELAKEFARQGHDVTVYAVLGKYDYSSFEEKYKIKVKNIKLRWQYYVYNSDGDRKRYLVDKVLNRLFYYYFEYPNIEFLYRLVRVLKNDLSYDAIVSIADPHHIHWGVSKLKKTFPSTFPNVWIADCGDPFMNNNTSKEHLRYYEKYERDFCKNCNSIVVPHTRAIEAYYPDFQEKISVIPQGFSFEIKSNCDEPVNKVPTFAYAGVFLKDIRNPETFLNVLAQLPDDFKFIVYTPYVDLIEPFYDKLKDKLEVRKPIERGKLLEELKSMDFLINIENLNTPTAVPSKIIDYAITGRPILSFNQENVSFDKVFHFIKKDYSNRLVVENIEDYHISNVAEKFIELIKFHML